jgi:hypothetical protein
MSLLDDRPIAIQPARTTSAILGTNAATIFNAGELIWFTDVDGLFTSAGAGNFLPIGALNEAFPVSTLPSGFPKNTRAFVTDATAATFGIAPTGSGSTWCPVIFNGSGWIMG